MKHPVIALGLDAADASLLEKWMDEGQLKNFQKLREQGGYGAIHNTVEYCGHSHEMGATEALWPAFLSGCRASTTGFWDIVKYDAQKYNISCNLSDSGYDYQKYPPFYALDDAYKVAVFDQPYASLHEDVNGIQLLGWGGTFPYSPSASEPANLYPQIVEKYGDNPILFKDTGIWWDKKYIQWETKALITSIENRAAIIKDLLRREKWDLFLTNFNEPHTAGHDLYHLSQPDHPLFPYLKGDRNSPDPLLETYKAIDRALGEILSVAPDNAYIFCFSPHGMGLNYSDLLSQTFLPEVLYRFSFPGKVAIAPGETTSPPPPMITKPIRNSWAGDVWIRLQEPNPIKKLIKSYTHKSFLTENADGLRSPYVALNPNSGQEYPMGWMPVMWFQPLWSKMKAFALPGFADGHIRINLEGREPQGIVKAAEYGQLCDDLARILYNLTDARTGKPLVKQVVRTRQQPLEEHPELPDSDLVVIWNEQMTDVVDSPELGRIGPVPYFRAGSHWERGFSFIKGPGIAPATKLQSTEIIDIPPTILSLMGASIPNYFEGKPAIAPLLDPVTF